jgi:hypothetical protein
VRVDEPGEDERVGDRDDGRTRRVWAVSRDTRDCVAVHHQLAGQHAAIDGDNRPSQDLLRRVGAPDDGRRRSGRDSHAPEQQRGNEYPGAHGRNALGTLTVIVTRLVLSSSPVRRAQSALPHIHGGLPAAGPAAGYLADRPCERGAVGTRAFGTSGVTTGCRSARAAFQPCSIFVIAASRLAFTPFEELSGCVGCVTATLDASEPCPARGRPPRLPRPVRQLPERDHALHVAGQQGVEPPVPVRDDRRVILE